MARHLWLQKMVSADFSLELEEGLLIPLRAGLLYEDALGFWGHYAESIRQHGPRVAKHAWRSAILTEHRYARGKNRENYLRAGELLLEALGPHYGLPGAPARAIFDWLLEREN